MDWLTGRTALVTGSGSGIGAAIARRLASEGAAVLVTDIQDKAGTQVAAEINDGGGQAAYAHLDVTSEADWEAAVALAVTNFGGLDIPANATSRPSGSSASASRFHARLETASCARP